VIPQLTDMTPLLGLDPLNEFDKCSRAADSGVVRLALMMSKLFVHQQLRRIQIRVKHDPPRVGQSIVDLVLWRLWSLAILEDDRNPTAECLDGSLDGLACGKRRDMCRSRGVRSGQRRERQIEQADINRVSR